MYKIKIRKKTINSFDRKFRQNFFLYYVNTLTKLRKLCTFSNCVKDILKIAYDEKHSNFARYFEVIFKA